MCQRGTYQTVLVPFDPIYYGNTVSNHFERLHILLFRRVVVKTFNRYVKGHHKTDDWETKSQLNRVEDIAFLLFIFRLYRRVTPTWGKRSAKYVVHVFYRRELAHVLS